MTPLGEFLGLLIALAAASGIAVFGVAAGLVAFAIIYGSLVSALSSASDRLVDWWRGRQ